MLKSENEKKQKHVEFIRGNKISDIRDALKNHQQRIEKKLPHVDSFKEEITVVRQQYIKELVQQIFPITELQQKRLIPYFRVLGDLYETDCGVSGCSGYPWYPVMSECRR